MFRCIKQDFLSNDSNVELTKPTRFPMSNLNFVLDVNDKHITGL